MLTYDKVHARLSRERGKASAMSCVDCGKKARCWTYLYNGDPELYDDNGRPYSEDIIECYVPRCQGCHTRFDVATDPRLIEVYKELGKRAGKAHIDRLASDSEYAEVIRQSGLKFRQAHRDRLANDPEYAKTMKQVGERLGAQTQERIRTDPEFAARMRVAAVANGRAMAALHKTRMSDSSYAQKVSKDRANAARVGNAKKYRCDECSLTAHAAAIGAHHKGSGHRGRTLVTNGD